MASVTFENASRLFHGAKVPAVDSLNLTIEDGECVVLVGPSGCGKSTSLRMVAGLEPTTSGRVLIGGKDMTGVRPRSRDVAMVFQSYALYPNMTVAQNMAFALENARLPKDKIRERVAWAAKMLELEELLERKPSALSGGQCQRVAMGRAIVRKPTVFCMDEPLSNLDAKLRVTMRGEIAALQRNLGVTTVYVTHDQVEAMTMGHRVAVMRGGKLQQIDTPQELYSNPVNTFVAAFIGSPAITLFTCPMVEPGVAALGSLRIPVPRSVESGLSDSVIIGVRPESWVSAAADEPGLTLVTDMVEMLGSQAFLYGTIAEPEVTGAGAAESVVGSADSQVEKQLGLTHEPHRIAVMLGRHHHPSPGDLVRIRPAADEIYFFDPRTEEVFR